ncbi:hypothetical protein G9A89_006567 [Geosiphon pyriformis]|nr:hypothetical protein G9A89_006567 [Geosiphon pyriformis]
MDKFLFSDNPKNEVKILLCIDKARCLISSAQNDDCSKFRLFRRAIRHINWNGFFVLFLDMFSKISNFIPPSSADPSARRDELKFELFRLTTIDIFGKKTVDPIETSEEDPEETFEEDQMTQTALIGLVSLLTIKLFGGESSFQGSKMSSIAVLSVLVCLDFSPQSKIASDLVMAMCVAVLRDREHLLIRYPSEPLLAEAALSAITDNNILISILQKFNNTLKKGFVDAGPRGKVVARIILILAVRSIQKLKQWKSIAITVKQLMELLDPAALDDLKCFEGATVAFTHFIPIRSYLNMLGIGRTYLENVRNHLATNGIIPRVHGNIKRVLRWKTKITIDITVAISVKNFLENYAEIHGLPSPGRNVNRITQLLTLLPAEMSYKSVYRDFIAGLENDSTLKLLKYDAFRKLWHQLMPYIQIMIPRTDLCDKCQHF